MRLANVLERRLVVILRVAVFRLDECHALGGQLVNEEGLFGLSERLLGLDWVAVVLNLTYLKRRDRRRHHRPPIRNIKDGLRLNRITNGKSRSRINRRKLLELQVLAVRLHLHGELVLKLQRLSDELEHLQVGRVIVFLVLLYREFAADVVELPFLIEGDLLFGAMDPPDPKLPQFANGSMHICQRELRFDIELSVWRREVLIDATDTYRATQVIGGRRCLVILY